MTSTTPPTAHRPDTRVSPLLVWFAVLGGTVAWLVHLFVAWLVMELTCLGPPQDGRLNQGGTPEPWATWVVWASTIGPWLVALAALLVGVVLRSRLRRTDADVLAGGRTSFLLLVGLILDAMTLAAITGGAVALLVLEPCG